MRIPVSILSFLFVFAALQVAGQTATIRGKVLDENGTPVEAATVGVVGSSGTVTDQQGNFVLSVPAGTPVVLVVAHIRFRRFEKLLTLNLSEIHEIEVRLFEAVYQGTIFEKTEERGRSSTLNRVDPKVIRTFPSAAGGVEGLIKTLPGVAKTNELTSQYSVRGGNYDENLVYVNDIEIYRPFLIRSGQQEGLSFINEDMVQSIAFSAGGFEAIYGDKMSSVLAIRYRRPRTFGGTVSASLLGGALHLEDVSKNTRLSWQFGARYKSNAYLLGALDTQGDYRPRFTDIQTYISYDITEKLKLNFLGNFSGNRYRIVPRDRETNFGTFNEALRFKVFFDGQEVDDYNTGMGAIDLAWNVTDSLTLRLITSHFLSDESNAFDIQGQYWLDELERDPSKEEFGEAIVNRGVGTYLHHARNDLQAVVSNVEHKGDYYSKSHHVSWGVKYQHEIIKDQLSEWKMVDSAGFSMPMDPEGIIQLQDVIKTDITLESNRVTGYFQDEFSFGDSTRISLVYGIRAHYTDLNDQLLISPRGLVSIRPDWDADILFRLSGGYYYQPPFYREIRDFEGNLNTDIKAQKSIHLVAGADINLQFWDRPFKLIAETYYKHMTNLVPYEYDNLRIRYYGDNLASGYATGVDMKLNGEFVNGLESWFSVGVMQTREDIVGDQYMSYFDSLGLRTFPNNPFGNEAVDSTLVLPGYLPRPTDQRVMVGIFFQDYLPRLPDLKMHLGLYFGTGLPFGPPGTDRFRDTLRMPPYRRVDIGFSYLVLGSEKQNGKKTAGEKSPFRNLNSLWLSAEVFNLLQMNNTLDYLWIKDIGNRLYAVPNYLTSRLVNLKLIAKF